MIDFHDPNNRKSYTNREVDGRWLDTLQRLVGNKFVNDAVDIGCGGGIYTKALKKIGIGHVTGIDNSVSMLSEAKEFCKEEESVNFQLGSAYKTGLADNRFDLVLQRALIHHLDDLNMAFLETYRILRKDGILIVQDRTPDDCFIEGSHTHLRGYFFTLFPHLKEIELKRRYSSEAIKLSLAAAVFSHIEETKVWETKNHYFSKKAFLADLRSRKGRSILHELTNKELDQLILFMDKEVPDNIEIYDQDRWTIWKGVKR
ncbi:class I SAM-dependent methyltransferase [Salipaludibacillus keqinensis]|nr:class I SAM-dependent methyltransferase [Salipaludibacillus keqinensis]